MNEPTIAAKEPAVLELEPGTYYWCACGRSANQPFCDGSHQDTEFLPLKFLAEDTKQLFFCGCKHSKGQPLCDGSHNAL
jgi:CDGSH-type Zn-finger protein